jgi:hypothetical protein
MTAKWTDFVSGAVLTAAQLNDVLDNFQDVAIFNEQQSSGTAGGSMTGGSYTKRTLNTTVVNNIAGCSISSSVITLAAGTYAVQAWAPAFAVLSHKLRLQNTTAATTIALGMNAYNTDTGVAVTHSFLSCTFTLTVQSTIELQHRSQNSKATNGLGVICSFGDNEVYAQIQIARIG